MLRCVTPIPLEDLPPCVFDPKDLWFGKAFLGDELYMKWYYEKLEELYDDSIWTLEEGEYLTDEDDEWE
jgi:hypothetical protein